MATRWDDQSKRDRPSRAKKPPKPAGMIEFNKAIQDYKSSHDKLFLSWDEVFLIFTRLGYRKESK